MYGKRKVDFSNFGREYKYVLGITLDELQKNYSEVKNMTDEQIIGTIHISTRKACPNCKGRECNERKKAIPKYRCKTCFFEFEQYIDIDYYDEPRTTEREIAIVRHREFLLRIISEKIDKILYAEFIQTKFKHN